MGHDSGNFAWTCVLCHGKCELAPGCRRTTAGRLCGMATQPCLWRVECFFAAAAGRTL